MLRSLALLLSCAIQFGCVRAATPFDSWLQYEPELQPTNRLAFAHGKFYITVWLPAPAVYTSKDGRSWTKLADLPGPGNTFGFVQANQDVFLSELIFGPPNSYRHFWIRDGRIDDLGSISSRNVASVAYHDGLYVGLSAQPEIGAFVLTSLDGIAWTPRAGPLNAMNSVTYGDGKFIAVGSFGRIGLSETGMEWESISSGVTNHLSCILFANGQFVAGGNGNLILTSPNGREWTKRFPPGSSSKRYLQIAYGNGRWVAAGFYPYLTHSADGVTWNESRGASDGLQVGAIDAVVFGNGVFVARANNWPGNHISADGVSWSRDGTEVVKYGNYSDVDARGGTRVAVSNEGVVYSTETTGWRDIMGGASRGGPQGSSIAQSAETFVIVSRNAQPFVSRDGISWTKSTAMRANAVAFGAGIYAAVADWGYVWRSNDDGYSWQAEQPMTNHLTAIAFGAGRFAASGELDGRSAIWTSQDAGSWTLRYAGSMKKIRRIAYAGGLFLATGENGLVLTSVDGLAWTLSEARTPMNLGKAGFGHGIYTIAGEGGILLTSGDGLNWNDPIVVTKTPLRAIIASGDHFLAVGDHGVIGRSGYFGPPQLASVRKADGRIELNLRGQIGTAQRVQFKDILEAPDWIDLTGVFQSQEIEQIADPQVSASGARFYRVISP